MMNRLTTRISNSLYVYSKNRTAQPNFLPLYQSAVFKCTPTAMQPKTSMTSSPAASRPSDTSKSYPHSSPAYCPAITKQSGLYPHRYMYTSLKFDPINEVLRIVTLRAAGYHTQEFLIDNVIPWSYRGKFEIRKIYPPNPSFPSRSFLPSWMMR
jgi:hypothetical protein